MAPPVAITGMGIVSSIGEDVGAFAESLRRGDCGVSAMAGRPGPKLSAGVAAELKGFGFREWLARNAGLPESIAREARRLGQRSPLPVQVSIASALEAWGMAGLFDACPKPERVGLIVAGQNSTQNYQYGLLQGFLENPEYLSPRYGLEFLETNQVGVLSELLAIRGEGMSVGGASATGNVGILKGCQAIQSGSVDVCLVAGVLADLSPLDIQGFWNMGAMGGKIFRMQPELACRPFDARHEGFIYGQAGACLVLEAPASAARRRVPVLAEVRGGAIVLDGNSSSDPSADGEVRAMLAAIGQGGCTPADVDYVNAHGSSSPLGDTTEAEAIARVFGDHAPQPWLNATKGLTGHCLYSAGVVEAVATVVQMRGGFLHPNRNLEEPVRKGLRFCGAGAVEHRIGFALSNSFGFGGINTSVLFARGAE